MAAHTAPVFFTVFQTPAQMAGVQRLIASVRRNELVCIAYEERIFHPDAVDDIIINPPLKAWLAQQFRM